MHWNGGQCLQLLVPDNVAEFRLGRVHMRQAKLSIIWKSDMTDEMKRCFFQAVVVSILLYRCTTWMLTKRMEKKLDSNYTNMLRAILNKSWKQHSTKQQLYDHLPPITKTIKIRRTRYAVDYWRCWDELISDVHLWTTSHGRAKAGRPARIYIQQICADTGCSPEDPPEAMDDGGGVAREGQGYTCWWRDMMMMMYIISMFIFLVSLWYHIESLRIAFMFWNHVS